MGAITWASRGARLGQLLVEQIEEVARGEDGDALKVTEAEHPLVTTEEKGDIARNGCREDEIVLFVFADTMDRIKRDDEARLNAQESKCVTHLCMRIACPEVRL